MVIPKTLSGKAAERYARRNIRLRGVDFTVTRPNPEPATTRTLRIMVQQMSPKLVEKLRSQGHTNLAAGKPVNFVCYGDGDIQFGDELPYDDAVYTVFAVVPQDYAG